MTGVHLVALVSAVVTLDVIIELSRRRHLHPQYAARWLTVCVVLAVFAISPGLFNRMAHGLGVISPPALLTVLASLFLLMVCVYLSWEVGRLEDKTRTLAEELAILRTEVEDVTPVASSAPAAGPHGRAGP